jgi:hypothetical protein
METHLELGTPALVVVVLVLVLAMVLVEVTVVCSFGVKPQRHLVAVS